MLSCPSGMNVSSRALGVLADALRRHRKHLGTRWRRLSAGRQALLAIAYPSKGETYADLACGFTIGTSTAYQGGGPAIRVPQRRRRSDPDTGRYRRRSRAQKERGQHRPRPAAGTG
ncbi:hypothetical protein GCM10027570_52040 [Streptomonospora sediminis]